MVTLGTDGSARGLDGRPTHRDNTRSELSHPDVRTDYGLTVSEHLVKRGVTSRKHMEYPKKWLLQESLKKAVFRAIARV